MSFLLTYFDKIYQILSGFAPGLARVFFHNYLIKLAKIYIEIFRHASCLYIKSTKTDDLNAH